MLIFFLNSFERIFRGFFSILIILRDSSSVSVWNFYIDLLFLDFFLKIFFNSSRNSFKTFSRDFSEKFIRNYLQKFIEKFHMYSCRRVHKDLFLNCFCGSIRNISWNIFGNPFWDSFKSFSRNFTQNYYKNTWKKLRKIIQRNPWRIVWRNPLRKLWWYLCRFLGNKVLNIFWKKSRTKIPEVIT